MDASGQGVGNRRKKDKKVPKNVFLEFTRDSDTMNVKEMEIGGLTVKRFTIGRFWQSEPDLHRWQRGLCDHSRFSRLLIDERSRYNEDMQADRADLLQNHSHAKRRRSATVTLAPPGSKTGAAHELRNLQDRIADPRGGPEELRGHITKMFRKSQAALQCDFGPADRSPLHTPGLAAGAAGRPASQRLQRPKGAQVTLDHLRTVSLLIFRNADMSHAGTSVLVRRWPPSGMAELLTICGNECRPVVGPAMRLLGAGLEPVRSLEEVEPGGAYVLKGAEGLDPPPLFFEHEPAQVASDPSLRNVARAVEALAAGASTETPPRGVNKEPSISTPQLLPLGSPPPAGMAATMRPAGSKWRADPAVAMYLSRGGLGQAPQHHHFRSWGRALSPPPPSGGTSARPVAL